jgi:hypothetical protein
MVKSIVGLKADKSKFPRFQSVRLTSMQLNDPHTVHVRQSHQAKIPSRIPQIFNSAEMSNSADLKGLMASGKPATVYGTTPIRLRSWRLGMNWRKHCGYKIERISAHTLIHVPIRTAYLYSKGSFYERFRP